MPDAPRAGRAGPQGLTGLTGPMGQSGKYSIAVGDGVSTSYVVSHNLGTSDVIVQVYASATPFALASPVIQRTDINTVTVIFSVAPASGAYRVTIMG